MIYKQKRLDVIFNMLLFIAESRAKKALSMHLYLQISLFQQYTAVPPTPLFTASVLAEDRENWVDVQVYCSSLSYDFA